jgi:hypothetical protein
MRRRGRLPVAECLDIATTLAAALGHLHRKGLVHRNVKPSNVICVSVRAAMSLSWPRGSRQSHDWQRRRAAGHLD